MIRAIYTLIGVIALGLGLIGIFLPLLPTTPFILLAAFCFMRGSSRMHDWLLNHKIFGQYIRDFQSGLGIPLRTKCFAISILWLSLAISIWLAPIPWAKLILVALGIGVSIYLWRLPTKQLN